MQNQAHILPLVKKINNKGPKFKTDDIVRISKYDIFLQNFILQVGLKNSLWLKRKKKTLFHKFMLSMMLTAKKMLKFFTKKNKKSTSNRT